MKRMWARERIEDSPYILVKKFGKEKEALLRVKGTEELELWHEHDDNPSYTVVIDGVGYEFVRSVDLPEKLTWRMVAARLKKTLVEWLPRRVYGLRQSNKTILVKKGALPDSTATVITDKYGHRYSRDTTSESVIDYEYQIFEMI